MKSAAKNVEQLQEKARQRSKQVIITETIEIFGLSMKDFNSARDDNLGLLKGFFEKWVGVDNSNDIHIKVGPNMNATRVARASLLQVNQQGMLRMRGSLDSRKKLDADAVHANSVDLGKLVPSIVVTIEFIIGSDRQMDIESTEDILTKLSSGDASSEVVLAAVEMIKGLCSDLKSDLSELEHSCTMQANKPTTRKITLDLPSSTAKPTNATRVAEAAAQGNLTDIGAAINVTDTPDLASAVQAQKLENMLSEETPRQSRPDQSLPGPPYPGAWGTLNKV